MTTQSKTETQQHTPGPWIADGCKVRALLAPEYSVHYRTVCVLTNNADARLIAAAPDMLAALEEASEYVHAADDETSRDLARLIRAAIAKATGAQS